MQLVDDFSVQSGQQDQGYEKQKYGSEPTEVIVLVIRIHSQISRTNSVSDIIPRKKTYQSGAQKKRLSNRLKMSMLIMYLHSCNRFELQELWHVCND